MADLVEEATWAEGIYQYEVDDPVMGGEEGIDNVQGKQLANRTKWLKLNKQDKNTLLSALAALSVSENKMIYATGEDTFELTTLTTFARMLLDDADAEEVRDTIGAQTFNTTLTAIAGLTILADNLIYATGADTFATTTLTAFARTLLEDVDAEAMRATLGVVNSIGVGQTWQDVSSIRASNTTYTNSSGKAIQVNVYYRYTNGVDTTSISATVDGVTFTFAHNTNSAGGVGAVGNFIVPEGSTYSVDYMSTWFELR